MSINMIRYIEELATNAWPAAVMQAVDGWRLRFNWGETRRANSVWPNEARGYHSLTEKLAFVKDFYTERAAIIRYQICPAAQPANLDAILAKQGYTSSGYTSVQIASIATVLHLAKANPAYTVTISNGFTEQWFATYCQAEQVNVSAAKMRRGILQRIGPRTGYALLEIAGQPVALGLGVAERGWVGIFSMTTQPEFRRQGAATTVLHALAQWGQRHQAAQIYLQVMENNVPARALYTRLGFETLYHYHYRELAA